MSDERTPVFPRTPEGDAAAMEHLNARVEAAGNVGPQRGPASVAQIEAQAKRSRADVIAEVIRRLDDPIVDAPTSPAEPASVRGAWLSLRRYFTSGQFEKDYPGVILDRTAVRGLIESLMDDIEKDQAAVPASTLAAKDAEIARLRSILSGVQGALADAGTVLANREDGDYGASVRELVGERDRLREELAEANKERQWVRRKLELPPETPFVSGGGDTLAGKLHVLWDHATGYMKYIVSYKCNDKQGEIARQSVRIAELESELAEARRVGEESFRMYESQRDSSADLFFKGLELTKELATANATISELRQRVGELERAAIVKDKVIADCERMLRFAPPPKHLAEDNQWHAAISAAQAELQMGRPGQQPAKGGES